MIMKQRRELRRKRRCKSALPYWNWRKEHHGISKCKSKTKNNTLRQRLRYKRTCLTHVNDHVPRWPTNSYRHLQGYVQSVRSGCQQVERRRRCCCNCNAAHRPYSCRDQRYHVRFRYFLLNSQRGWPAMPVNGWNHSAQNGEVDHVMMTGRRSDLELINHQKHSNRLRSFRLASRDFHRSYRHDPNVVH